MLKWEFDAEFHKIGPIIAFYFPEKVDEAKIILISYYLQYHIVFLISLEFLQIVFFLYSLDQFMVIAKKF